MVIRSSKLACGVIANERALHSYNSTQKFPEKVMAYSHGHEALEDFGT